MVMLCTPVPSFCTPIASFCPALSQVCLDLADCSSGLRMLLVNARVHRKASSWRQDLTLEGDRHGVHRVDLAG